MFSPIEWPSFDPKEEGANSSEFLTPESLPRLKLLSFPWPELDRLSFLLCFSSFIASAVSAISYNFNWIDKISVNSSNHFRFLCFKSRIMTGKGKVTSKIAARFSFSILSSISLRFFSSNSFSFVSALFRASCEHKIWW